MFFENGSHPYADAVLDGLTAGLYKAVVPILWRYEASAVLSRALNRGVVVAQNVALFIEYLERLPVDADDESGLRVFPDVFEVAVKYRLSGYGAAYPELALRRSLTMATLDTGLIAACRASGVSLV